MGAAVAGKAASIPFDTPPLVPAAPGSSSAVHSSIAANAATGAGRMILLGCHTRLPGSASADYRTVSSVADGANTYTQAGSTAGVVYNDGTDDRGGIAAYCYTRDEASSVTRTPTVTYSNTLTGSVQGHILLPPCTIVQTKGGTMARLGSGSIALVLDETPEPADLILTWCGSMRGDLSHGLPSGLTELQHTASTAYNILPNNNLRVRAAWLEGAPSANTITWPSISTTRAASAFAVVLRRTA